MGVIFPEEKESCTAPQHRVSFGPEEHCDLPVWRGKRPNRRLSVARRLRTYMERGASRSAPKRLQRNLVISSQPWRRPQTRLQPQPPEDVAQHFLKVEEESNPCLVKGPAELRPRHLPDKLPQQAFRECDLKACRPKAPHAGKT